MNPHLTRTPGRARRLLCATVLMLANGVAHAVGHSTTEAATEAATQAATHSAAVAAAQAAAVAPATQLDAASSEPRAFGYQVGDVVSRTVTLHAPDGLTLDEASVPQPGARGRALELRSVARRSHAEAGGRRHELTFEYQVFLSPPQTRTLEMPAFVLRLQGRPRDQDVRIEAWPVTVSPLMPPQASPRRGLGELQPDTPPPLIDTAPGHQRLLVYAGLMLAMVGYLAHVTFGLPWRSRARRPFTLAWKALRGLSPEGPEPPWRAAIQRLHGALNRTAGEAVFEHGVDRFIAAQPRFEHLRADLITFFGQSRRAFFEQHAPASADRAWLIEFCRRCRDAERGSA